MNSSINMHSGFCQCERNHSPIPLSSVNNSSLKLAETMNSSKLSKVSKCILIGLLLLVHVSIATASSTGKSTLPVINYIKISLPEIAKICWRYAWQVVSLSSYSWDKLMLGFFIRLLRSSRVLISFIGLIWQYLHLGLNKSQSS